MARRKSKRLTKKRTPARKKSGVSLSFKKRRGRDVYDLFLPKGSKREVQIDKVLDSVNLRNLRTEDYFVKVTFVSKFKKQHASITYILEEDYDNQKEFRDNLRQNLKDINYTIFRKPVKGTGDSIKRMNRLKNFLQRIIIDFETAD